MTEKPIKLNLRSGDKPLDGYINLDAKYGDSLFPIDTKEPMPCDTCSLKAPGIADEIRASHVLEHFAHGQTQTILKHWVSKLKPGGVLKIAVPDFEKIAREYLDKRQLPIEGYVCGGQTDEYDYHKALFDEPGLRAMMAAAGLEQIGPWTSEIADCASLPISLNLMGTKPRSAGKSDIKHSQSEMQEVKIAAIMSVPRLTFTENVACIYRTIGQLGIRCHAGQGVFWHHALTRQFEDRIAEGNEFILAIDYDTWFLPDHVLRLVELMIAHPEADAICSVQCEREGRYPLLGLHDESGQPIHELPRALFRQPLTRIHTAHFGLTLFRAAAFAKVPKPWLRDEPDPSGSWREGRKDADIAFWHKWELAGRTLFQANDVNIGHLQLVCTFSGPVQDDWRPVHVYLRDLNAGRVPDHCKGNRRDPAEAPLRAGAAI